MPKKREPSSEFGRRLMALRQERRLWKKLRQVAQLPERDQRAVLRIINSVAATAARKAG